MKYLLLLFIFPVCVHATSISGCHNEYIEINDIEFERHSAYSETDIVNFFPPKTYKGIQLLRVSMDVGKNRDKPVISSGLPIKQFKGKQIFQIFANDTTPIVTFFIRYGENCAYTLVYKYVHS